MSKTPTQSVIRLRGARHNNLKNFDLSLPLHRLIVITGLSGSGKSSLAFDTLFAEGQRRYIETFSPYARQFFDRMDKPRVDSIEGIPPAIAIEQRNAVKSTRSTVGTMTEICDYMKMIWSHIAQLYCRQCGRPVRKDSPQRIWETLQSSSSFSSSSPSSEYPIEDGDEGRERLREVLITFDLPLTEKISLEESLGLITKQGYQRLLLPPGEPLARNVSRPQLELNEATTPWGGRAAPSAGSREIAHIDEAVKCLKELKPASLTVIQDRVKLVPANRARFVEACEQAYHFGKGKLAVRVGEPVSCSTVQRFNDSALRFSNRFHCASCDIEYREPTPAMFSFNHPLGACPACRGFGRIISIAYDLALPDRSKTLAEGLVKPWQSGVSAECQDDLMKFCKIRKAPTDVPFDQLPKKWQRWVIEGDPDYDSNDPKRSWPRAWYGVKGYFRWLESKAYKMHVRVLLSRYRSYTPCPDCGGRRFQPESLLYRFTADGLRFARETAHEGAIVNGTPQISLADFYALPIRDALALIDGVSKSRFTVHVSRNDPVGLVLNEVRSRLAYLNDVGLGYLTLDRPTRTLSGGETERVNLTTCLGTRLVNTLYVLDEPSVGLHPRDTARLVRILEQLRDLGNTVVVVEHEASVIRAADQIVDLGPGHGESGGHLVYQGAYSRILKSARSLTGHYLSGRKQIEVPVRRNVGLTESRSNDSGSPAMPITPSLRLTRATRHNLQNLSVEIPLSRFVCVTGVSGSGKTTLVREVLVPALEAKFKSQVATAKLHAVKASERIEDEEANEDEEEGSPGAGPASGIAGHEHLSRVVLVDQSPLGKTPRSNPAVYIGAFDDIRELFAQTDGAKQRGLNASAFSFNSTQGQCERCRGAGFEKIEMQFLSDVFIRCPDCDGRRYRPHILEVKVGNPKPKIQSPKTRKNGRSDFGLRTPDSGWSVADLLEATVDEVVGFLAGFADSRHAHRASERLKLLQEVGLGYLRLGQPINTLSGGESQRLKLVSHLAESAATAGHQRDSKEEKRVRDGRNPPPQHKPTMFLFDEPTTGLHFDDVRVLLKVFQRLVDAGHSVLVIEHNLDVIKCADWVIDLGPEAGDEGGQIIAQGTPEDIAAFKASHTGRFLREVLGDTRASGLARGGTALKRSVCQPAQAVLK